MSLLNGALFFNRDCRTPKHPSPQGGTLWTMCSYCFGLIHDFSHKKQTLNDGAATVEDSEIQGKGTMCFCLTTTLKLHLKQETSHHKCFKSAKNSGAIIQFKPNK